jgi:hypothetical protein
VSEVALNTATIRHVDIDTAPHCVVEGIHGDIGCGALGWNNGWRGRR